jgi:hypothetical protein
VWTNEIDFDETITTVIDDDGLYEDVQLFIDDTDVYLKQWNEELDRYDIICMSPKMWLEIQRAMTTTEGMFRLELE